MSDICAKCDSVVILDSNTGEGKCRCPVKGREKWIPYGPGCDLDPDVVKNTLRYCADWDDSGPAIEIARKSITALQQREERRKRAIDELKTEIRFGRAPTGSIVAMMEVIEILEETDG